MRVLVTGVNGFIGRHLAAALVTRGDRVVGLVRPGAATADGIEPLAVDLAACGERLPDVDGIVHLAQGDASDPPGTFYAVNASSVLWLARHLEACGGGAFVLASTGSVYGDGVGGRPAVEADLLLGDSFYAVSKIHAERFAELSSARLDVSVVRPFFPYGPGSRPERLVAHVARCVHRGEPVRLNAAGRPAINPVFVADAVDAIVRCLDAPGGRILNLAGPDVTDIPGLAELVGSIVGRSPTFETTDTPAGDVVADIAAFRAFLGRDPVGLRDGLAATLGSD